MSARGTTNRNDRGSSEERRRRKAWLLETFRANVDAYPSSYGLREQSIRGVPLGQGVPACRCYRCGDLLTLETLTVDRRVPKALGGTYRRDNIRPACGTCNSETGVDLRCQLNGETRRETRRARRRAA